MYRILVISFYLLICLLASAIAEEISADHTNSRSYQITTGALHSCAIDDEGVKCWGENEHSQLEVPPLSNPMQISSSFLHTCAIDDTGVVCWGWNRYKQLENIPAINDLQEISAGYYSTCVIDQGDVVCWGAQNISRVKILLAYKDKWDPVARFPVPQAKNPRSLSVGANHGSVIDDSGVICWGANSHGQTENSSSGQPKKSPNTRGSFLCARRLGCCVLGLRYPTTGFQEHIKEYQHLTRIEKSLRPWCRGSSYLFFRRHGTRVLGIRYERTN